MRFPGQRTLTVRGSITVYLVTHQLDWFGSVASVHTENIVQLLVQLNQVKPEISHTVLLTLKSV